MIEWESLHKTNHAKWLKTKGIRSGFKRKFRNYSQKIESLKREVVKLKQNGLQLQRISRKPMNLERQGLSALPNNDPKLLESRNTLDNQIHESRLEIKLIGEKINMSKINLKNLRKSKYHLEAQWGTRQNGLFWSHAEQYAELKFQIKHVESQLDNLNLDDKSKYERKIQNLKNDSEQIIKYLASKTAPKIQELPDEEL